MIEKEETYYDILGIPTTASLEEIKRTYKKQALINHPDSSRNRNLSDEEKARRTERFNLITEVFRVLEDEEKRALYDKTLEEPEIAEPVFEIVQTYNANNNSQDHQSLVISTPISFNETIKTAKANSESLEDLAKGSLTVAQSILGNEDQLELLGEVGLSNVGLVHEEIAKAIVSQEDLWSRMAYYPDLIFELAEKYVSVCKIIFSNSKLLQLFNGKQLFSLQEKHALTINENSEISKIIDAYKKLRPFIEGENNTDEIESDVFKQLLEVTNFKRQSCASREILERMAENNVTIARIIAKDPDLLKFLGIIRLSCVGLIHKEIALDIVMRENLWSALIDAPHYIFDLAEKYESVCELVFANSKLVQIFNGEQLLRLQEKYDLAALINKNSDLSKKIEAYKKLRPFIENTNNSDQIEENEFKQLFEATNFKQCSSICRYILETMAKNSIIIAIIIVKDPELRKLLGDESLKNIGLVHKEVAKAIVFFEDLWSKLVSKPHFLFELAEKYRSVCRLIFKNPKLVDPFSGEQLFKLTAQYGKKIADLITTPELFERLRAYILLVTAKNNSGQLVLKMRTATRVKITEAMVFYELGVGYERQNTPETIELAQDYFYRAAKEGLELGLEALIRLVNVAPDPIQQLKIAEVYFNPQLYFENQVNEQADLWCINAALNTHSTTIDAFCDFIKKSISNLKNDIYTEAYIHFYLDVAKNALEWHCSSSTNKYDHYRSLACSIEVFDAKIAANCLKNIPEEDRNGEDWYMLANMALQATRDEQIIAILDTIQESNREEFDAALKNLETEQQKIAERVTAAFPLYLQAIKAGYWQAKSVVRGFVKQFIVQKFPENHIVNLLLQKDMVENFSLLLEDPTTADHISDNIILAICRKCPTILEINTFSEPVLYFLKNSESIFALGLLDAQQNKKIRKFTLSYWEVASKRGHTLAKEILALLELEKKVHEKDVTFLHASIDWMLEHDAFDLVSVQLLGQICQLPIYYTTIREQFNQVLTLSHSRRTKASFLMFDMQQEVFTIQRIISALQSQKIRASTLPPLCKKIENEIDALLAREITDKSCIFSIEDALIPMERNVSKLQTLRERVDNLPPQYIAIREKIGNVVLGQKFDSAELAQLKEKVDQLETGIAQLAQQYKYLMSSFKSIQSHNFLKQPDLIIAELFEELNKKIQLYYERDFSSPRLEKNDLELLNTLSETVDQYIKKPLKVVADCLIRQIKDILFEPIAPSRLAPASTFFNPVLKVVRVNATPDSIQETPAPTL